MDKRAFTIILFFLAFGVVLLLQASRVATSVVLTPTELIERSQGEQEIPRVRIAGRVVEDSIRYRVDPKFELRFRVAEPESDAGAAAESIPVVYYDVKPDMFAPGRDVILDGDFRDGEFQASQLLTQCPSKYEPPSPADQQAGY